jgi:4-amino-4-deoxy-L-arabinose transferase-like glycosyltransferase
VHAVSAAPPFNQARWTPSLHRTLITIILTVALAARLWFLSTGVPHAVGIDEPAIVDRALGILNTGSWNTHAFDYPSLVIYLHALVAIVRFLLGAARGEWASLADFDIGAILLAGRFVTALIGTATVWMTWRVGRLLHSPALGLVAAAQLALLSLHVRESHFILTDVPVTALCILALWLSLRASTLHTVAAFAWAGAAIGLTAAAKYNGGVVAVALLIVWLREYWEGQWGRKAAAAILAMIVAFTIAAPYSILDLPGFLNGFAAQMSRFAIPRDYGTPIGMIYLKHLALQGRLWVFAAGAGIVLALARRERRGLWWSPLWFAALYFYVLETHTPVFARYALPLVPVICLLAAVPIVELAAVAGRFSRSPAALPLVMTLASLAIVSQPAIQTVSWIEGLKSRDTRVVAADWMRAQLPQKTRLVVEISGPTYMSTAGFSVTRVENIKDRTPAQYVRSDAGYLVISSGDLDRYQDYAQLGKLVFEIAPLNQRPGPPVRIIQIDRAEAVR